MQGEVFENFSDLLLLKRRQILTFAEVFHEILTFAEVFHEVLVQVEVCGRAAAAAAPVLLGYSPVLRGQSPVLSQHLHLVVDPQVGGRLQQAFGRERGITFQRFQLADWLVLHRAAVVSHLGVFWAPAVVLLEPLFAA